MNKLTKEQEKAIAHAVHIAIEKIGIETILNGDFFGRRAKPELQKLAA